MHYLIRNFPNHFNIFACNSHNGKVGETFSLSRRLCFLFVTVYSNIILNVKPQAAFYLQSFHKAKLNKLSAEPSCIAPLLIDLISKINETDPVKVIISSVHSSAVREGQRTIH